MGYGTRSLHYSTTRWPSDPGCLMTINPDQKVMDSSSPATKRAGDIGSVDLARALPCKSKSFPSLDLARETRFPFKTELHGVPASRVAQQPPQHAAAR